MPVPSKSRASASRRVRPSRGRRPERASGDDREQAILETAERLLEERALSEISVDDLAKGAGISRPTFYFYFPSKDAVVITIIERVVPAAAASREETLKMVAEDPRAAIRKAIGDIYSAFRERPGVAMAGAELRRTNEAAREIWSQIIEGWVADTTAIIELERARGAVPPGLPARDLATALVQMNEQVQHATFLGESPAIADEKVIDVCVDIWLRAIYGSTEPG
jgi:AcrR family transcriptional regulator